MPGLNRSAVEDFLINLSPGQVVGHGSYVVTRLAGEERYTVELPASPPALMRAEAIDVLPSPALRRPPGPVRPEAGKRE
jgi:hypothetical protein